MAEPIKILVVEDHFATLDGLVLGLSQHSDFNVVGSCSQANDGLELLEKLRPDVCVLDLHLPGVTDASLMLESFLEYVAVKFVIFSSESRLAYIQSVLSMGVSAYLLKSERVAKVADTIRLVMKGETGIISQELTTECRKITPSEQEVLHMLGQGLKYHEIAEARHTSVSTARKQCEVLILKLNLENREHLIAWAVKNGYGTIGAEA
jgi:two-component system response regulator DesR